MGEVDLVDFFGTPSRIRTCDPLLRRQMLYPLSYGRTLYGINNLESFMVAAASGGGVVTDVEFSASGSTACRL